MAEKKNMNDALFKNHSQSNKMLSGVIVTFLIVMLVAFSKFYLPNKITSELMTPKLNENLSFSTGRSASLVSCIYDVDQNAIEIMMLVNNKNTDGIDKYYYAATGVGNVLFKSNRLKVEEVINTTLCTVVRIYNVKGFDEIEFLMAPQIAILDQISDADTLMVQLNKYNVSEGIIDTTKTEKEYLADRLDFSIQNMNDRIIAISEEKAESEKTIIALKTEIEEIEKSKAYLTDQEKVQAEEKIKANTEAIESLNSKIEKNSIELEELNINLEDAIQTKEKIINGE